MHVTRPIYPSSLYKFCQILSLILHTDIHYIDFIFFQFVNCFLRNHCTVFRLSVARNDFPKKPKHYARVGYVPKNFNIVKTILF